jgi:hypothetical protein
MTLLLMGFLVGVPTAALAGHEFPDVPTGHPFHDDIGAIAQAGITAGFTDGTYRPGDPVTRQSMAAFMHRGFGRVGFAVGPITEEVHVDANDVISNPVLVRALTVTVPGANNAYSPSQLVHLTGRLTLSAAMGPAAGCPCDFAALLVDPDQGTIAIQRQTFTGPTNTGYTWSFDVEGVVVAPPGPRTFELYASLGNRETSTDASDFAISGLSTLSAQTFPFGPTGGNTP